MSVLSKLTEGIVNRDMKKEGQALLAKWEKTGLLEGLDNETKKNGMARLLENQAKELLREASSMAGGDVEGFSAVAFPIVRRVFGGLIANDLVSVQPMSLPSGLIFFLDFTYGNTRIGNDDNGAFQQGKSIYGGNVVASQITGGISLTGSNSERGFYSLNNGYASPTGSMNPFGVVINSIAYGTASGGGTPVGVVDQGTLDKLIRFDPDLSGSGVVVAKVTGSSVGNMEQFNVADLISFNLSGALSHGRLVRRLTQFHTSSTQNTDPSINTFQLQLVFQADSAAEAEDVWQELSVNHALQANFVIDDNFQAGGAVGSVVGATAWALENTNDIPEINIKVDSVAVTAMTKKLKAKWTPELGQDLNAYHNLDAEVELTSILSEQIALEIDQEILNDLIIGANFIVTSPEIASILEFTAGFRAAVTVGEDRGTAGAMKVGSLSKKLDVYVDPYFPRNLMLVGRRGNSFLESGYVYAPYVPLQVTPTIFGVEDFVPRKGVMTRYAKKMVRPDMYGLVVVRGLIGEAGATS